MGEQEDFAVEPTAAQHSFSFEAAELPTKAVIVYSDRAEVKRLVHAHLSKGTNELVILNVSAVIERQSVRVDGTGIIIQEVQYQEMPIDTIQETEKVRQLEDEKYDLECSRGVLEDEIMSLRKRTEVLDGVAAQIASGAHTPPSPPPDLSPPLRDPLSRRHSIAGSHTGTLINNNAQSSIGFLMDEDYLNNLAKFLSFYGENSSGLKAEMRKKMRESEKIQEQIEHLERRIDQLRCGYEYDSIKRNISIIVEADCEKDIDLFVSYQVYCAGWKPSYDIRAVSTFEDDQTSSVKLCYYGLVEQNTGDVWKEADMVLSTATPSIGGCAPPLATLTATLSKHPRNSRQRHASSRRKPLSAASEEDMGFGSFDYNELADAAALQRLTLAHVSSDSNSSSAPSMETMQSACFSIPRPVTIPSNGVEHKVLVAQIDLSCAFRHEAVPCRSSSAYLSAIITNTSQLPLLPGAASIYLNNSFVSKTHLPAVAPGDEFRCSLGMDPAVKIEYKPPTRTIEQVGFMSKSSLITHDQVIALRNAKVNQCLQITVKEQIPKSTDDKIKVAIVCPDIRGKSNEARLNKDHNLEWTIVLGPGQQKDLHIKYTIRGDPVDQIKVQALKSAQRYDNICVKSRNNNNYLSTGSKQDITDHTPKAACRFRRSF